MEANCKIWINGANFMMDGYINDECETFILVPGHGSRSAMSINASIFGIVGYTIYPG